MRSLHDGDSLVHGEVIDNFQEDADHELPAIDRVVVQEDFIRWTSEAFAAGLLLLAGAFRRGLISDAGASAGFLRSRAGRGGKHHRGAQSSTGNSFASASS
jgi:hypothetical protein